MNNYNTNGIFNSNYSTSNPFNMGHQQESFNKFDLMKAQQQMQQMNNQPIQQQTVFSDISNELKDLSKDENSFIVNSVNYQKAFNKYQEEFSEFLISKFANEFVQVNGGRSAEELLFVIRQERENYKNKFSEDINQIRDQNKTLLESNNKLAQDNLALQQQLQEIQNKLWRE